MAEVNWTNIKQFIQGNIRMFADTLGRHTTKYLRLPLFIQEQIYYRSTKCQDCLKQNKCLYCGCSVPGKWFADNQCDGKRWPSMMLKSEEWEAYKKANKIEINLKNV